MRPRRTTIRSRRCSRRRRLIANIRRHPRKSSRNPSRATACRRKTSARKPSAKRASLASPAASSDAFCPGSSARSSSYRSHWVCASSPPAQAHLEDAQRAGKARARVAMAARDSFWPLRSWRRQRARRPPLIGAFWARWPGGRPLTLGHLIRRRCSRGCCVGSVRVRRDGDRPDLPGQAGQDDVGHSETVCFSRRPSC